MTEILEGITVLDFTSGMAGSIATMVLSDFGAESSRSSRPRATCSGHFQRRCNGTEARRASSSTWGDGRRKVQELARRADVVVESFRPGTADRLGIGYDALSADHPGLVYCSITGYGPVGPYAGYKAYEGLIAAKCGRLMSFAGQTKREGPGYGAVNVASHSAAMAAARGMVAALLVRDTTGRGQRVETSLLQAINYYDISQWIVSQMMERFPEEFPPAPANAARRPPSVQYLQVRTRDGHWIQLANLIKRLFVAEIRAIGLGHIFDDPRFARAPELEDDAREELRRMILRRMQDKTLDEWMDLFVNQEGDVAAEPFMTSRQGLAHPQMLHNGMVQEVIDPTVGPMRQVGVLSQMDATPASIKGPAPLLGQHTEEILRGLSKGVGSAPPDATHGSPCIQGDPTRSDAASGGPLAGVTVLDLSTVIAGPLSASLAAELGARVIRIETLQGDQMRLGQNGIGANRTMAGTEGLSLDLKSSDGQAILAKLIPRADILVHNMRPGAPERVGIGLERARELNPEIIYVYVGGYGSTGPYNRRPAMHPIGGAVSGGALAQAGRGALPPADAPMTMDEIVEASRMLGRAQDVNPDPNTSMVAATAMVLALYARQRLGKPQYVEVSMIGANAYANADDFFDYDGKPDRAIPDADGFGLNALYRLYEASDGWVFLACPLEGEFRDLCDALDLPDLADDPRFSTPETRQSNDDALAARLASVFATKPAAGWETKLSAADVGCVKVEGRDMFHFFDEDDHVRQNGFTTEAHHPRFGSFWRHAPVLGFSETPGTAGGGILRGQHTIPILKELGYSEAEVHTLRAKGVLDWEEAGHALHP